MGPEAPRSLPQLGEPATGAPAWLPLAWFGCGVVWLFLSGLGLTRIAAQLSDGNVYSPPVFAVTHGLTLGFVTSAIFGALHQFIPVVLSVPIRRPGIAIAGFWLSQAGTALLVHGMWHWNPRIQLVGWSVLFAAVGCASWNILPARRRASQNRIVGGFVTLGHSALGFGMLVAFARIGQGMGWWQPSRDGLLLAHLHLGLVGFGSLTAAGIGSRMLPVFLKSRVDDAAGLRRIGWLASMGLVTLTVGSIWSLPLLARIGGAITLAAVVQHLVLLLGYVRGSGQSRPDAAQGFIVAAIIWYAVTAVTGASLLVRSPDRMNTWAVYVIAGILGWLVHLTIGVLHRIGPRLMAGLVAARGGTLTPTQARAELPHPRLSLVGLTGLTVGTAGLLSGVGTGSHWMASWAAWAIVAGLLTLVLQAAALAAWLRKGVRRVTSSPA